MSFAAQLQQNASDGGYCLQLRSPQHQYRPYPVYKELVGTRNSAVEEDAGIQAISRPRTQFQPHPQYQLHSSPVLVAKDSHASTAVKIPVSPGTSSGVATHPAITAATYRATKKAIIALKTALAAMQKAPPLSAQQPVTMESDLPDAHRNRHQQSTNNGDAIVPQPQTIIQITTAPLRMKPRKKKKLFQKAALLKVRLGERVVRSQASPRQVKQRNTIEV
jgi:hypothetical protein